MDKIKKMALTLLVFAIGLGIMNVNATQYTVGVKVGDKAEYSAFNNTVGGYNGTLTVEVTKIEGTIINYNLSWNPPNSGSSITSGSIDVSSSGHSSGVLFIAQNLNVGDVIPSLSGSDNLTVNDVQSREYFGQMIEVNHANRTLGPSTYDFYWIKSSGMLAEEHVVFADMLNTLTIQNTTTIPEFPVYSLPVLTFVVATLLSAIILHRKKYATRTPKLARALCGRLSFGRETLCSLEKIRGRDRGMRLMMTPPFESPYAI
jgi:hypothetical protein